MTPSEMVADISRVLEVHTNDGGKWVVDEYRGSAYVEIECASFADALQRAMDNERRAGLQESTEIAERLASAAAEVSLWGTHNAGCRAPSCACGLNDLRDALSDYDADRPAPEE